MIGPAGFSTLHAEPRGGEIWYSVLELRDPGPGFAYQGMTMMIRSVGVLVLVAATVMGGGAAACGQPEPDFSSECQLRIESAFDALSTTNDFDRAEVSVTGVFDLVIAHADKRKPELFVEAAYAVRLVSQLKALSPNDRKDVLTFLRGHEQLGRAIAMLIRDGEDPAKVYAVLQKLRGAHGDEVARYPSLTAAICVVRDRPLTYRVNENTAQADTPEAIFDYFTRNEKRLSYPISTVPPELLMYVVDTTAKVSEMEWALSQYKRDKKVGNRFFEIHYDTSHLKQGTPKKITEEGFDLPNIKRYGGVCADQAYFAVSVAKAQGIPSAYTRARAGGGGHAWVGYLDSRGRRAWWDFNAGRYEEYQGLRGDVINPQTGTKVSDAAVSMLSQLIGVSVDNRLAAVAMTDAAERLAKIRRGPEGDETPISYPPTDDELPSRGRLKELRLATVESELDLLEAGLRRSAGHQRSWVIVARMGQKEELSFEQKKYWADALMRMCGNNYPDFTLAILKPMVTSIEDEKEQNRMWNALFKLCEKRADLAAEVRIAQGDMWQRGDNKSYAWQCYEDTAIRYVNDGPFAIVAMERCEGMLRKDNKLQNIVPLYEDAWRKVKRPNSALMFSRGSNWYMIGVRYAKALNEAGRVNDANIVLKSMGLSK